MLSPKGAGDALVVAGLDATAPSDFNQLSSSKSQDLTPTTNKYRTKRPTPTKTIITSK